MNLITLLGNTTRDFEVRYSQSATPVAVARAGLAVRRQFSKEGQQDTDFFNLVAFGKTAENLEKFFKKGSKILIEGHVQTGTYEKDGVKHATFEIVVDRFHFVESRKDSVTPTGDTTPRGFIPTLEEEDDSLPF